MATCKDCFHFEVCDSGRHIGEYELDDGVYTEGVENECLTFKPTAAVAEVKHTKLRIEIRTDCFKNQEFAKAKGWYRKFLYCSICGLNLRTETWDDHYMFGMCTVLKNNEMPKHCPDCGQAIDWSDTK